MRVPPPFRRGRTEGAIRPKQGHGRFNALLPLLALGACAAMPGGAPGEDEALTGYLAFAGEFQVYQTAERLRGRNAGGGPDCVSGIFSSFDRHEAESRRFHGKRVRLVGRYEPWAPHLQRWAAMDPLTEGSPTLQNKCGGERVFVAEAAYPVKPKARASHRLNRHTRSGA